MKDAMGMPIITALANRDPPGWIPIFSNRPNAIAMKMAVQGTSETTVESAALPARKAKRTLRLSVPARASSQRAKRRSSPELMKACAMQNIAMTKKKTVLMKLVNAVCRLATRKIGWRARARSEVTATGVASVTQRIRVTVNTAAIRCPSAGSPAGVGSSNTRAAAIPAAAMQAGAFRPLLSAPTARRGGRPRSSGAT
jgi:hypothetical protein